MKRVICVLGVRFRARLCGRAGLARRRSRRSSSAASLICGVSQGAGRLRHPGRQGQLDRSRRRFLPRDRGGDLQRCRPRSSSCRSPPRIASPRCNRARSTCCSRNTTWTSSRDTSLGLNFAGVNYYDGQGFMVRKALKVNSALELNGASVCTQTGTTTELNLADFFRANKMKYEIVAFATADETIKAYDAGRCDVFTTDVSQLYAERLKLDQRQRPRHPAGDHLQGAARPGGAPWRRPMVRHREMDPLRDDQRRGARRHVEECRRGAEIGQARDQAAARHRRQPTASSSA